MTTIVAPARPALIRGHWGRILRDYANTSAKYWWSGITGRSNAVKDLSITKGSALGSTLDIP
jgi:hypothetical protein